MADDLASATAEYRAAEQALSDAKAKVHVERQRLREARRELTDEIVAQARAGTRVRDLVETTQLSREWIRQLLRANGVSPD